MRRAFRYERPSKEELERLYWDNWLSYSQIAERLNIGCTTVRSWIHEYGITPRKKGQLYRYRVPKEEAIRLYIEEELSTRLVAEKLGIPKSVIRLRLREWGVSRTRSEAWKTAYKRGRRTLPQPRGVWKPFVYSKSGYKLIHLNPDDPFGSMAHKGTGYVAEHRLVMAKKLGRCLHPWESIHHKNSIRTDNRPENLLLVLRGNHQGRVKCPSCQFEFGVR